MNPNQLRELLKEELAPIIKTQQKHTRKLEESFEKLEANSQKLDTLTAEINQVHKLADATVDIVKGRYEKNKREINEIKDHLKLSKEPYYGSHDYAK